MIAVVGEFWGEDETELGRSFIGPAGRLLTSLLSSAGIVRRDCLITSVINQRFSDIKQLLSPSGIRPAVLPSKYLREEFRLELDRLYAEIREREPNIIIAAGPLAAWAFLHSTGIKDIRGATAPTVPAVSTALGRTYKVMPTYAPASVLAQWKLRPVVMADLAKARRQSADPVFSRPSREIWIKPDLADIAAYEQFLSVSPLVAVDIETRQDQITCIGFSPSPETALVIPFFTESGTNYWRTREEEISVWRTIARWLTLYPSVFQNGLYDINFLWTRYGIPVPAAAEDTMLLHHAMQPEMEKGLGFLASLYTEEASWKFMRKGMSHD